METQKFVDAVLKEFGVVMVNHNKVARAVYGTSTNRGLVGGVGEEAEPALILAKYDSLGGYITKNDFKVKNRTFFDVVAYRKGQIIPVKSNKIVLLIRMNGEYVEHEEGEPESLEIQVAKKQQKEKKQRRAVTSNE